MKQNLKEPMETSVVAHYSQKFLDLIEIKFKEWKFPLNHALINEVKKWQ